MDVRPTFRLRVSTRYRETPEVVWAQKTDPEAIMAEFPPWVPFRVTRPADLRAALADGAERVRSPARLGLLPWEVQLTMLEPGRAFEDRATTALFDLYVHTHRLQPVDDGTHYLDDLWFAPRVAPELVARILRRTFVARHRRAARSLAADPLTVGHAVLRHVLEDERLPESLSVPSQA